MPSSKATSRWNGLIIRVIKKWSAICTIHWASRFFIIATSFLFGCIWAYGIELLDLLMTSIRFPEKGINTTEGFNFKLSIFSCLNYSTRWVYYFLWNQSNCISFFIGCLISLSSTPHVLSEGLAYDFMLLPLDRYGHGIHEVASINN